MDDEYPDPYVEALNEMEEDEMEEQAEGQQEMYDDISPSPEKKDDLYSLFWKVVKTSNSSKVGNLSKEELGQLNMSVRDLQKIFLLGVTLGHEQFANFFRLQSEITLSTSASKDGWLPELFVSQRKFTTKKRDRGLPQQFQQQQQKKKWSLFGKK